MYAEDLKSKVDLFYETAEKCDAKPEEKRKEMLIMLKESAQTQFTRNGRSCVTFREGVELIRSLYN